MAYIINVRAEGSLLNIDAEHVETNQRWSGEFTSHCNIRLISAFVLTSTVIAVIILLDIEEITLKAGNYKRFSVFAKMLKSALSHEADSLFIDLLTYSDLESLKAKKLGNASSNTSVAAASNSMMNPSSRTQLKRYIILTYTGEYDRVHYPLPLSFEEIPNVDALKRTIRRLRAQLEKQPTERFSSAAAEASIEPYANTILSTHL